MNPQEEMFVINQGRPSSRYFVVATAFPGSSPEIGKRVVCRNLKANSQTIAVCRDYYTFEWIKIPDSFCLLHYGINSLKLKTVLENSFPEFREKEQVRFLLLEEI